MLTVFAIRKRWLATARVLCYHPGSMTDYHLTPPTTLPSLAVQEAKEKRRKVLEAVRARRKIIYSQFMKKRRLQAANDLVIIA